MTAIPLEIDSNAFCISSPTAIVLFSGGFDSTVSLWWAMQHYEKVTAITVNYNQPHKQELDSARQIIALTDVRHDVVTIDIPDHFWGIQNHDTRWQPVLLCSIAALDVSNDGADIILGSLKTDPYPDSKPEFLRELADAIFKGEKRGVKVGIVAPLVAVKNKAAAAVLGYRLGAPLHLSWSCRFPINNHPCYECGTCKDRYRIIDELQSLYEISEGDLDAWSTVLGSPYHASFQNVSSAMKNFAEVYADVVGFKHSKQGWRYHGPDGTERITSMIKHPSSQAIALAGSNSESMHIRVHGFLEDGTLWEVYICKDGSVAATECLPNFEIIKSAFMQHIEL